MQSLCAAEGTDHSSLSPSPKFDPLWGKGPRRPAVSGGVPQKPTEVRARSWALSHAKGTLGAGATLEFLFVQLLGWNPGFLPTRPGCLMNHNPSPVSAILAASATGRKLLEPLVTSRLWLVFWL